MAALKLVIGDKTRSSWSLRPWLFLRHHGVDFEESVIQLNHPQTVAAILRESPSGRVPILLDGPVKVWESLAICEYAAETFALPRAWPLEPAARALARALACEMHAGFADLRKEMPFDAMRKPAPVTLSEAARAQTSRIASIWREARSQYGKGRGEWLFGPFGIVDAMFAPVALRFHSYGVNLLGAEVEYLLAVLEHPAIQRWIAEARAEQQAEMDEAPLERTSEISEAELAAPAPVAPPAPQVQAQARALPPVSAPASVVAKPMPAPSPAAKVEPPAPKKATLPEEEAEESLAKTTEVLSLPELDDDEIQAALEKLKTPAPAAAKSAPTPAPVAAKKPPAPQQGPGKQEKRGGPTGTIKIRSVILPPD